MVYSAWIEEKCIKEYFKFKKELNSNKSGVQDAVAAIEEYIANGYVSSFFKLCT